MTNFDLSGYKPTHSLSEFEFLQDPKDNRSKLGLGSFATVKLAREKKTGTLFALKLVITLFFSYVQIPFLDWYSPFKSLESRYRQSQDGDSNSQRVGSPSHHQISRLHARRKYGIFDPWLCFKWKPLHLPSQKEILARKRSFQILLSNLSCDQLPALQRHPASRYQAREHAAR